MSAGIPGLGLGGLFFVICALLAPFWELAQTVRGRSSAARWAQTLRQFALAVAMVGAFELARRAIGADALSLRTVAITAAVLAAILLAAKAADLAASISRRRRPSAPAASPSALGPHRYYPVARLASDPEA
jgi:hypothetical protein